MSYDLDEAFEADPLGVTSAVVAHAAATAAAEVARLQHMQQQGDFARLAHGQAESASLPAIGAVVEKYGADEWERLSPLVQERLLAEPHLIPPGAITSPGALARSLEPYAHRQGGVRRAGSEHVLELCQESQREPDSGREDLDGDGRGGGQAGRPGAKPRTTEVAGL